MKYTDMSPYFYMIDWPTEQPVQWFSVYVFIQNIINVATVFESRLWSGKNTF